MADFTIYIANKNYSSWSLRAWLMLKRAGVSFHEVMIPLRQPDTRSEIMRHSPSGRVPALKHGNTVIWESLAIGEYLNERYPAKKLWPSSIQARAAARSASAEMHAGFLDLRRHLPMNMRGSFPNRGLTPEAQADCNRITALWRDCRKRFRAKGGFLFGSFSIADAMYAPVVSRLRTYAIELEDDAAAYCEAVEQWPAYQEWLASARKEPMIIEEYEF
ncbi:MAG TPA: glutathione S-transferase family protein [Stellaceae bacterium]|jgi:glutathione S-transferase|nr:glutathione S-transferase family protein [Stellaceae bacterium]